MIIAASFANLFDYRSLELSLLSCDCVCSI